MPLPQPAEYDDAIQSPQTAFSDSDLRYAINDGPLRAGIPGPIASGNFAIVYRLRFDQKRFAVKCFTREKIDQQSRYKAIHDYLATKQLPWTVDFKYIQSGIRVHGKWHPILKMEWLDNSVTLQSYLTDAIRSRKPLEDIRDQFHEMLIDLRANKIAHGDLQHGNLIVSDGRLRIIDYDGMCVPGTQGLLSQEDGLPDYQHPARHGGQLQFDFDNFAALVIWASLHALTIDPQLWTRHVGESERMLFRRDDFLEPNESTLIRELISYDEPDLRLITTTIASAATAQNISNIPFLGDVIRKEETITIPWWKDEIKADPELPILPTQPELPNWIQETQTPPVELVRFTTSPTFVSFVASLGMVIGLIFIVMPFASALPIFTGFAIAGGSIAGAIVVTYLGYRTSRESRERSTISDQIEKARQLFVTCEKGFAAWVAPRECNLKLRESLLTAEESKLEKIESEIKILKQDVADQIRIAVSQAANDRAVAEGERSAAVRTAHQARNTGTTAFNHRMSVIESDLRTAVARHQQTREQLLSRLTLERATRFKAKFDPIVQAALRNYDINNAPIAGITYPMIQSLKSRGICTAADFDDYDLDGWIKPRSGNWIKIPGIGYTRARGLVQWRLRIMKKAEEKIPLAERNVVMRVLNEEEDREKRKLDAELLALRQTAEQSKLAAKADLDRNIATASAAETQALQSIAFRIGRIEYNERTAKANAKAKEEAGLGGLNRTLWLQKSVVNPARSGIHQERKRLERDSHEMRRPLEAAMREQDSAMKREASFAKITYWNYFKLAVFDK